MTADFGTARAIDALAFGEPGARTFQLRILGGDNQSAALWMEKQQLQALSLALTQVLAQLGKLQATAAAPSSFPETAEQEFTVGRMSIGFDAGDKTLVLLVFDITRAEEEEDPDLRVRVTDEACVSLNLRLQEIISAGRPLCPLCGMVLDPAGHPCIRANGHLQQPIPDDRIEDD